MTATMVLTSLIGFGLISPFVFSPAWQGYLFPIAGQFFVLGSALTLCGDLWLQRRAPGRANAAAVRDETCLPAHQTLSLLSCVMCGICGLASILLFALSPSPSAFVLAVCCIGTAASAAGAVMFSAETRQTRRMRLVERARQAREEDAISQIIAERLYLQRIGLSHVESRARRRWRRPCVVVQQPSDELCLAVPLKQSRGPHPAEQIEAAVRDFARVGFLWQVTQAFTHDPFFNGDLGNWEAEAMGAAVEDLEAGHRS